MVFGFLLIIVEFFIIFLIFSGVMVYRVVSDWFVNVLYLFFRFFNLLIIIGRVFVVFFVSSFGFCFDMWVSR